MKPGERKKFMCNDCLREFEVILEPQLEGLLPNKENGYEEGTVACCPFCESRNVDDG